VRCPWRRAADTFCSRARGSLSCSARPPVLSGTVQIWRLGPTSIGSASSWRRSGVQKAGARGAQRREQGVEPLQGGRRRGSRRRGLPSRRASRISASVKVKISSVPDSGAEEVGLDRVLRQRRAAEVVEAERLLRPGGGGVEIRGRSSRRDRIHRTRPAKLIRRSGSVPSRVRKTFSHARSRPRSGTIAAPARRRGRRRGAVSS